MTKMIFSVRKREEMKPKERDKRMIDNSDL